jgi:hypothetical protein
MNIYNKLLPEDLYHSYLIEGDPENAGIELVQYLKYKKIIGDNDPDLFYQKYESLTIGDSREIKEWHSRLPNKENGCKICLVGTNFINREAEQALLKIIEEPGQNTHFFVITPDISILLDTIKSRTHSIKYEDEQNKEIEGLASKMLTLSTKDRLDLITKMIKDKKSEESSGPLRRYASSLIGQIENIIYQNFKKNPNNKETVFKLEELEENKKYLNNPGASVKMVLEHIALII